MAEINEKLSKLLKEVGEVVDLKDRSSAVWSLPQNQNVLIVKHKALEKKKLQEKLRKVAW